MNAHDRRVADRYWPHVMHVNNTDHRYNDIVTWLHKNLGSCNYKKRTMPRWCWRPTYVEVGNFSQAWVGTQFYFRKDKDYAWFLLKWDGQ